jgi:hypothetical protein
MPGSLSSSSSSRCCLLVRGCLALQLASELVPQQQQTADRLLNSRDAMLRSARDSAQVPTTAGSQQPQRRRRQQTS